MKIITISCDIYADTAPAFVELIRKNWPDCKHEIEFVTNSKKLNVKEKVYYLDRRGDMAFGWRLRRFIRQHYTEPYLLFMMSDYFVKSVDPLLVAHAHELCVQPGIHHVRLRPMPHPPFEFRHPGFGMIDKSAPYSLSLQPGIWETAVLYDLLRDNENPWQTETTGSRRAAKVPGTFLSVKKNAISHVNYYRKGRVDGVKWVRENVSETNWPEGCK